VDWKAITRGGNPATNYQLMPNDRIFVKSDLLIAENNWITKTFAPLEKMMGVTLLGATTTQAIEQVGIFGQTLEHGGTTGASVLVGR
jgi:hypothetical protein